MDVDVVPCCSNVTVESCFQAIEHSRMGHTTRLRATDFVLWQMEHVIGKMKELLLPLTETELRKSEGCRIKMGIRL